MKKQALFLLVLSAIILSACNRGVSQPSPLDTPADVTLDTLGDTSQNSNSTNPSGDPNVLGSTSDAYQPQKYDPASITELKGNDLVVGTGAEVKEGDTVVVHYTGQLADGTVFDSSVPRRQPFVFTVGGGQVIQGWELGLMGMKEGGKRLLFVPPAMAYGPNGVPGAIPPNSPLIFQIELINIQDVANQ